LREGQRDKAKLKRRRWKPGIPHNFQYVVQKYSGSAYQLFE